MYIEDIQRKGVQCKTAPTNSCLIMDKNIVAVLSMYAVYDVPMLQYIIVSFALQKMLSIMVIIMF